MTAPSLQEDLADRVQACTLCADRFALTKTQHAPRPVFWLRPGARILICGQAPGQRVHQSGRPFSDPSGDRLRQWMGIEEDVFYDRDRIAILPMAACFPGYDAKGSDLPPPKICEKTWRAAQLAYLGDVAVTLLIGGYAQRWHLGAVAKDGVTATVSKWRDFAPKAFALPHPSWRNTGWLKRHPWFEAEVLPALKSKIAEALTEEA